MAFLIRAVRAAGGIRKSLRAVMKMNDLRAGTLVGTDMFGNKYFENSEHFYGRDRWVDYERKDYDASQVPPEWHRWLHHIGDHTPVSQTPVDRKFHLDHSENHSGTRHEYVPYSTTQPKISPWQPPTLKRSSSP